MQIAKSAKLQNVCYDIRGPVLKAANAMEEQGHRIIKLNMVILLRLALKPLKKF